jgi:predicted anti-sigma-YlaC factor YlaD
LASGCYVRSGLGTLAPTPGTTVRVNLKPEYAAGLTDLLGAGVSGLDGRVFSITRDTMRLDVSQALHWDQSVERWHGERVALALGSVSTVEGRRLSVAHTALLAAGFATALIVLARAFSTNLPNPNYPCNMNC